MLEKFKKPILGALGLSLLVHFGAVTSVVWFETPMFPDKPDTIDIVYVDPNDQKSKQVIEQEDKKSFNEEAPKTPSYLGKHNQKILKETRAQKTGVYNNEAGQNGQKANKAENSKPKKITPPTISDLKPIFQQQPRKDVQDYSAKQGQESRTSDHLQDVETGLQTLLNTREFVYYSYYQRIRSRIRQHWEPNIKEKVRKIFAQGRSLASPRDRLTRVLIVLNKSGKLMTVKVLSESGLKDLDDAAIDAFRAAEPFPNPPVGIVEKDGTIRIHWDFILEA